MTLAPELIIDADSHVTEPRRRVDGTGARAVPRPTCRTSCATARRTCGARRQAARRRSASRRPRGGRRSRRSTRRRYADVPPAAVRRASARLRYMDEAGIWAQVLYPNVGGFGSQNFLTIDDEELKLLCVARVQRLPARLGVGRPAPAAPDRGDTVLGHRRDRARRSSAASAIGAPRHPLHRRAPAVRPARHRRPALGPAVGGRPGRRAADPLPHRQRRRHHRARRRPTATRTHGVAGTRRTPRSSLFMKNGVQCCDLITSGVLPRFPDLKFVSVESGIGWLPFMLEADRLQLARARSGPAVSASRRRAAVGAVPPGVRDVLVRAGRAEDLLDVIPIDNVLFETDFPHTTCLFGNIEETIERARRRRRRRVRRKILWGMRPPSTASRNRRSRGGARPRPRSPTSHRRVGGDVAVTGPLAGVRVVEVASHVFVPMAGAVLNEWGADVIKIEHPETGDPYRGLVTAGSAGRGAGVDPRFHSANRGKRSSAST